MAVERMIVESFMIIVFGSRKGGRRGCYK